ncbi:hypothetical protein E4U42_001074 [Claviceps africana]|uniref:PPP4R2-domain-containing protein n=1 Tax=Claviceps africana TaxID=83212 RepID=A0A8K0JAA9_9HYPO|nr:hypothetical protein E4U42_001074 [Claviceps africana]
MDADHETETLIKIASGEPIDEASWLELRPLLLARLDKIAHHDFSIPRLPPPRPRLVTVTATATANTSTTAADQNTTDGGGRAGSQEADKENAPTGADVSGELPKQINDMLLDINKHLETFRSYPPHTIQRLAELLLRPKAQYRALAPYLHAVDRVVRVSSTTNTYPLPPAIFDMSKLGPNGEDARNGDAAAAHVAWSNPTVAALGTDESLGGALLTPIPWLTRRSPEGSNDGEGEENEEMPTAAGGAQIHSEATETIDGPNGVGSIETVSVSVNGIPSTGHHTRGVTQGELLRQEQRAGVVPVSQLERAQEPEPEPEPEPERDDDGQPPSRQGQQEQPGQERHGQGQDKDQEKQQQQQQQQQQDSDVVGQTDDDDEVPHARGPDKIGIEDTGPQGNTASYMEQDGSVSMQRIDVEAALGRKDGPEQQSALSSSAVTDDDDDDGASSASSAEIAATKREAQQDLGGDHKKMKKDGTTPPAGEADDDASSAENGRVDVG